MRRSFYAVVFLMLLFGISLRARGEDVAQPVPSNAKCSVAAEKGWTPQEKFVWNRVCIGAVADLNSEPGYGGDLDPTRPEGLPKNRILGSTFLETILVENKYRHALTRYGVRISGARFTETVDLSGAELAHDLILFRSLFDKGAYLIGLKSTHTIALSASKVTGTLEMDSVEVDQHLFIGKSECGEVDLRGAHIGGQIDLSGSKLGNVILRGAHVGGQIDLHGSKVTGTLEMRSLQVGQDLLMQDKAKFGLVLLRGAHVGGLIDLRGGSKVTGALIMDLLRVDQNLLMNKGEFGNVRLLGAHVGGEIALIGSKVTGMLNMGDLHVDQDLLMGDKAAFGNVSLLDGHVGGQIDLGGSKVTGMLNMGDLHVDQDLLIDKAEFAEVLLRAAHVGGQINLGGSKVIGKLDMDALHVDQNLLMGDKAEFAEVLLRAAHVGGQINLGGSKVTGKLDGEFLQAESDVVLSAEFSGPVDLVFAQFSRNLVLAAGSFKNVDITGAQIGNELHLGSSREQPAHWSKDSSLILRNTKADALQDLSNSWPDTLDLNGFTYRALGGILADERDPMIGRPVEWFKGWLGKQRSYAPTPYEQLATVLRSQGRRNAADEILYASKERERAQATFLRYIWLTAYKCLIGYGYHVESTFFWIAGLLIAGVLALRLSGEGRVNGMPYGIVYSFDMLLPIIRLREKHYQIDLHGPVRYYFYFHRIMGYVLASFLIVWISGLTTK